MAAGMKDLIDYFKLNAVYNPDTNLTRRLPIAIVKEWRGSTRRLVVESGMLYYSTSSLENLPFVSPFRLFRHYDTGRKDRFL